MRYLLRTAAAIAFGLVLAVPSQAGAAPVRAEAGDGVAAQAACFYVTGTPETNANMTGKRTVRTTPYTDRGRIEVRAGYWNGALHGWARVIGGNPQHAIVLKVDQNGDRVVDESYGDMVWQHDGTSCVYPAAPSPNRAFKACVRLDTHHSAPCNPRYQTGWW
jgi:hypothetical protein